MLNPTIPAIGEALPSRRWFLTKAAGGLAGGLVAAAAAGQPALAALPVPAASEPHDPVIALAARYLEADRASNAASFAKDECREMWDWRRSNPAPVRRKTEPRPNVAMILGGDRSYIDTKTAEALSVEEAWPHAAEADAEHKETLTQMEAPQGGGQAADWISRARKG